MILLTIWTFGFSVNQIPLNESNRNMNSLPYIGYHTWDTRGKLQAKKLPHTSKPILQQSDFKNKKLETKILKINQHTRSPSADIVMAKTESISARDFCVKGKM